MSGGAPEALAAQVLRGAFGGTSAGWGVAPPPCLETWRRVVQNPTVALARMIALTPACDAVSRGVVRVRAGSAGSEAVAETLTQIVQPLVAAWVRHGVTAADYGYAAAEVVWGGEPVRVGGRAWAAPARLKPLLADLTEAVVDEWGGLAGAKNNGVRLEAEQVLWVSHGAEADDPYGRARAERVRKVWHAWEKCLDRLGQYAAKVAGVTPIVEFPEGESFDERGRLQSNYDLAVQVIAQLGLGLGVAMPNVLARYAADLAERGVGLPDGSKAWNVDFLEPRAAHGSEIVAILQGLDRFLLRGYLVPERAAVEGEHGTKAEAEEHGGLVALQADEVGNEIRVAVQGQLLDPIVRRNLGSGAVGAYAFHVPPLADEQAALVRRVVGAVLTTPATMETIGAVADYPSMMQSMGVPLRKGPAPVRVVADAPGDDEDAEPAAELSRFARRLAALRIG